MTFAAQSRSPSVAALRSGFERTRAQAERFPLSVIQLAMRIGVGAVFFKSGLLKINSWEFAVKLFEDEYKVPLLDPILAAQVTALIELTVPVLLFLGLGTRLATLLLSCGRAERRTELRILRRSSRTSGRVVPSPSGR